MAELRKYGVQSTINFPLITRGTLDFNNTPVTFASGDTKIKKDEGASANTTNNPSHEGEGIYSLVLDATEMQAARIVITVIDSATKVWEDQAIIIDTYGNSSAELTLANYTQAISELSQAKPSATPSLDNAIMLLYMTLRNKLDVTSSAKEVHNDAGTVICKKTLSDDGSVYIETEMESGP